MREKHNLREREWKKKEFKSLKELRRREKHN